MDKFNLEEKFAKFGEQWTPKIVAEMNGQYVKLAKAEGETVWHTHEHEDEFFMVVRGELHIHLEDRRVSLGAGECFVVPKGVRHKTSADRETHFVMIEPKATQHTGDVWSEQTVALEEQEWL